MKRNINNYKLLGASASVKMIKMGSSSNAMFTKVSEFTLYKQANMRKEAIVGTLVNLGAKALPMLGRFAGKGVGFAKNMVGKATPYVTQAKNWGTSMKGKYDDWTGKTDKLNAASDAFGKLDELRNEDVSKMRGDALRRHQLQLENAQNAYNDANAAAKAPGAFGSMMQNPMVANTVMGYGMQGIQALGSKLMSGGDPAAAKPKPYTPPGEFKGAKNTPEAIHGNAWSGGVS